MTNFRNLKIEINDQQPLDDVVKMLESKGYRWGNDVRHNHPTKCLIIFSTGIFDYFRGGWRYYDLTTLAELKEM